MKLILAHFCVIMPLSQNSLMRVLARLMLKNLILQVAPVAIPILGEAPTVCEIILASRYGPLVEKLGAALFFGPLAALGGLIIKQWPGAPSWWMEWTKESIGNSLL